MKKTLVIGASDNPERYAYKAISMLQKHKHPVEAIGRKEIDVLGVQVHKEHKAFEGINTVTLYVNPKIQQEYYDYILSLKPQRVVFNPGTENPTFYKLLEAHNIGYEEACTLVLLTTGQY
jgi:predicted CoA-binding protein